MGSIYILCVLFLDVTRKHQTKYIYIYIHDHKFTVCLQCLTSKKFLEQVAEPCEVIKLMETQIDQPNFYEPDPFVLIEASGTISLCIS